jgi:uncharacterized membrane protein required for colicin V production
MYFTILDLILILILFLFISFGFVIGFIQTVGALVGVVAGAFFAGQFFEPVSAWLEPVTLGNPNLARVIAFVVVFVLINRLVGLLFWIIDKVFGIISLIPFTKTLNRLLGALLGLIEGTLVVGLIVYFMQRFSFSDRIDGVLGDSAIVPILSWIGSFLKYFLPAWLR